jgi:hypothetical protein
VWVLGAEAAAELAKLVAAGVLDGGVVSLVLGFALADICLKLAVALAISRERVRLAVQLWLLDLAPTATVALLAGLAGYGGVASESSAISSNAQLVSEAMRAFTPVTIDMATLQALDFASGQSDAAGQAAALIDSADLSLSTSVKSERARPLDSGLLEALERSLAPPTAADAAVPARGRGIGRKSDEPGAMHAGGSGGGGGSALIPLPEDDNAEDVMGIDLGVLAALERGMMGSKSRGGTQRGGDKAKGGKDPKASGTSGKAKARGGVATAMSELRQKAQAVDKMLVAPAKTLNEKLRLDLRLDATDLVADVFVVHSHLDHPDERKEALREWAAARTRAHGKPPTAWISALCTDPLMVASEQLRHLPVYVARSSRLLLLVSHTITSSARAVVELLAFAASGGAPSDVDCVLVCDRTIGVADRQKRWAIIAAAFDTFNVAATHQRRLGEAERLASAMRLVGDAPTNELVRTFAQAVRKAATDELEMATRAHTGGTDCSSSDGSDRGALATANEEDSDDEFD